MERLIQPTVVTPGVALCHLHLSSPRAGDRRPAGAGTVAISAPLPPNCPKNWE